MPVTEPGLIPFPDGSGACPIQQEDERVHAAGARQNKQGGTANAFYSIRPGNQRTGAFIVPE